MQNKILQNIAEVSNYKKADVVPFGMRDDVRKAEEDFRYMSTQAQCHVVANLGFLAVSRHGVKLGDVMPVPYDTAQKYTAIPKDKVRLGDDNMYVAAVCYADGKAVDVLMFSSKMFPSPDSGVKVNFFKKCLEFFKPKKLITFHAETNEYILRIKNPKDLSMRKYGFGVILGQLQG